MTMVVVYRSRHHGMHRWYWESSFRTLATLTDLSHHVVWLAERLCQGLVVSALLCLLWLWSMDRFLLLYHWAFESICLYGFLEWLAWSHLECLMVHVLRLSVAMSLFVLVDVGGVGKDELILLLHKTAIWLWLMMLVAYWAVWIGRRCQLVVVRIIAHQDIPRSRLQERVLCSECLTQLVRRMRPIWNELLLRKVWLLRRYALWNHSQWRLGPLLVWMELILLLAIPLLPVVLLLELHVTNLVVLRRRIWRLS
jgi:hypothetical protein